MFFISVQIVKLYYCSWHVASSFYCQFLRRLCTWTVSYISILFMLLQASTMDLN